MVQQAITPLLGAAADAITLESGGKKYTVQLIKQFVKTQWEAQLRELAMAAILPLKAMDREAFLEAVAKVSEQSTQGLYGFHGDVSVAAMGSPGGFIRLVALIFQVELERAGELLEEDMDGVADVLDQVMVRSYPKRAEAMRAAIAERKARMAAEKAGETFDPNS